MRVAVLVPWMLAGCGSTAPAPTPAPPMLSIEPASGPLVQPGQTEVAPPKAGVVRTADYAATGQRWALRFGEGTTSWAVLRPSEGGRAEVALRGERSDAVDYRFVGNGVRLAGRASTDSVSIYGTIPLWFGEVILAEPSVGVDWRRAGGELVRLRLVLGEDLQPREHRRIEKCSRMALARPDIDVGEVVDREDLQTWLVDGDDPVPIYRHAESVQPAVVFHADDGTFLQGGQLEGDRRRVVLERYDYTVVGWSPANRLRLPTGIGFGSGGGGTGLGLMSATPHRQRRDYACRDELALYVEHDGERAVVGRLEARRPFWLDDLEAPVDGWRPLHLDDDPVDLTDGARWVVAETRLASCEAL